MLLKAAAKKEKKLLQKNKRVNLSQKEHLYGALFLSLFNCNKLLIPSNSGKSRYRFGPYLPSS